MQANANILSPSLLRPCALATSRLATDELPAGPPQGSITAYDELSPGCTTACEEPHVALLHLRLMIVPDKNVSQMALSDKLPQVVSLFGGQARGRPTSSPSDEGTFFAPETTATILSKALETGGKNNIRVPSNHTSDVAVSYSEGGSASVWIILQTEANSVICVRLDDPLRLGKDSRPTNLRPLSACALQLDLGLIIFLDSISCEVYCCEQVKLDAAGNSDGDVRQPSRIDLT